MMIYVLLWRKKITSHLDLWHTVADGVIWKQKETEGISSLVQLKDSFIFKVAESDFKVNIQGSVHFHMHMEYI